MSPIRLIKRNAALFTYGEVRRIGGARE